jgi:hypothetical protein
MALDNIEFDITSKNTFITLIPPKAFATLFGISAPIVFTGAGRNKWFDISQSDNSTVLEVACDGSPVVYVKPAGSKLQGEMTFNASSPTISQLASLTTYQNNFAKPQSCSVIVENTSTLTTVKYSNFFITKLFTGWSFDQNTQDYTFPFECMPPNYLDLASMTSIAGSI